MISLSVGVSLLSWVTEWQSDSNCAVTLTIGIILPSIVASITQWVSELLIWDCKFGYTSQCISNIILTLRCIRLHDAHWRIRTRPLVITGMTKLTRHHPLQLEGSSRALPFCQSLTTWQVCDVRRDAGGGRRNAARRGMTTPRRVPRHAAIPSRLSTHSRSLVTVIKYAR